MTNSDLDDDHKYEYKYTTAVAGHHHDYLLPAITKLLANINTNNQHKLQILDLGCGNGSLSNAIAQQGYQVTGIEDSLTGVENAHKNFPDCKFIHASVYDLPYKHLDQEFDIIISAEVIEHLVYPRELIKAAHKLLKPQGSVIITTPYHGYIKNLALALSGKMDSHFTALWDGGHIKFFSVKTLTQLLTEEGFSNCKFEFAGRYPYLWKSMLVVATKS